jgi:repressor LexA
MTNSLLTAKQKRFYDKLKTFMEKKGAAPTVQEMMAMCDIASPRAVTQYLEALEKKGLIERSRYEHRGIKLRETNSFEPETVTVPVMASAGCDNVNVLAQQVFDEYICVSADVLEGKRRDNLVCIRAVGDSMEDAGIVEGDHVLVEHTQAVSEGDLVVAIIDGYAVIKKLEHANNAIILKPVSSNPEYRPIILNKNFNIFGKVIDVIRKGQSGDLEVVPVVSNY